MDIVERLRNQGEFWPKGLANEAVKEIKILREALQKIADIEGGDIDVIWKEMRGIARAALKGDK